MLKTTIHVITFSAAILVMPVSLSPARAQPASGLYQISSGRYIECCGIAGQLSIPVPNIRQSFVELDVDSSTQRARMNILGADRQTVFGTGFTYSLSNGVVFPDRIEFGSPFFMPNSRETFVYYVVSNTVDGLRINGTVVVPCVGCADIPTQFRHTNVLSVPAPPHIEGFERAGNEVRFRFKGYPPNDFFVEASDSLPATQWLSLTNYRAKLQPIEVTFIERVTDPSTRFYRIRQEDCQCD